MITFTKEGFRGGWQAYVRQGCQTVPLGGEYVNRSEAQWYARMFRKALKAHDAERMKKDMGYRRKVRQGT